MAPIVGGMRKASRPAPAALTGEQVQYGVLPYVLRDDGRVEVLLVTSRNTQRWVVPKGWPIKGMKPHTAAAQEAYEEAGVVGRPSPSVIGAYQYLKRLQ